MLKMHKKIILTMLATLLITPVMAGSYHADDDNINSDWLKALNSYLFNEGRDELNKDISPPEWITTVNGPRLDYLHDGEDFDNPINIDLKPTDTIIIDDKRYIVLKQVSGTDFLLLAVDGVKKSPFNLNGNNGQDNTHCYATEQGFDYSGCSVKYEGSTVDKFLTNEYINTLSTKLREAIVPQAIHQEFYSFAGTNNRWNGEYVDLDNNGTHETLYSNDIDLPKDLPSKHHWKREGKVHPTTGEAYPEITRSIYLPAIQDFDGLIDFTNSYDIRNKLLKNSLAGVVDKMMFRDLRGDHLRNTMTAYSNVICTLDGEPTFIEGTIRPAMVVDVTKIDYTKLGNPNNNGMCKVNFLKAENTAIYDTNEPMFEGLTKEVPCYSKKASFEPPTNKVHINKTFYIFRGWKDNSNELAYTSDTPLDGRNIDVSFMVYYPFDLTVDGVYNSSYANGGNIKSAYLDIIDENGNIIKTKGSVGDFCEPLKKGWKLVYRDIIWRDGFTLDTIEVGTNKITYELNPSKNKITFTVNQDINGWANVYLTTKRI